MSQSEANPAYTVPPRRRRPGRCCEYASSNGTDGVFDGVPVICTGKPGASAPVAADTAWRYQCALASPPEPVSRRVVR